MVIAAPWTYDRREKSNVSELIWKDWGKAIFNLPCHCNAELLITENNPYGYDLINEKDC